MLWMAVTPDEYELPCAVAETAGILARITGESEGNIRSQASRHHAGEIKHKNGRRGTYRFYKVEDDHV